MPKTKADFEKYHEANPRVYTLFCYFADKVLKAGYSKYSAEAIFNQIRWYSDIETTGDKFKINNNFRSFYSRKWMDEHNNELFYRRKSRADC